MKQLIDHIREFGNAISSDLESGSHERNNQASEVFWHSHPALSEWVKKLSKLADKVEEEGHNQKWLEEAATEIDDIVGNVGSGEHEGIVEAIRKHLPLYDPRWVETAARAIKGRETSDNPPYDWESVAAIIRKHIPKA